MRSCRVSFVVLFGHFLDLLRKQYHSIFPDFCSYFILKEIFVKQVPEEGAIAEPHRIPLDVLRGDGDCNFFSAARDIHVSSNSRHFNRALFHTVARIRKQFFCKPF